MNVLTRPAKWDTWRPAEERLPDEAWEAMPDTDWTIDPAVVAGKRCRRRTANEGCPLPAVAALNRAQSPDRRPNWWAYCEQHLYNRWVEDGQVLIWRVKPEWRNR